MDEIEKRERFTQLRGQSEVEQLIERLLSMPKCLRPEGCVCGGDTLKVRQGCHWYDETPLGREAATALTNLSRELEEANLAYEAVEQKLDNLIYSLKPRAPDLDYPTCGCSLDKPTDVCLHHSPQLSKMTERAQSAEAKLAQAVEALEQINMLRSRPISEAGKFSRTELIARTTLSQIKDSSNADEEKS